MVYFLDGRHLRAYWIKGPGVGVQRPGLEAAFSLDVETEDLSYPYKEGRGSGLMKTLRRPTVVLLRHPY